jgi:hypothetical protein
MQTDLDAQTARDRLGATLVLSTHLYVLTAAVRAMIAAHPDPEGFRRAFDQLVVQMQTHQAFLLEPDQAVVLKDFVQVLLQPPVKLDIDSR